MAAFERILRERRLLPLIGSRLADSHQGADPRLMADVEQARRHARARGQALEAATDHVIGVLSEAGIDALTLKGTSLAQAAHGDLGLRESADVDLLVSVRDLDRATEILRGHGYEPPRDAVRANGLPDLHWSLPHPHLPTVELHWRIHWYERDFSADLLARAERGSAGLLEPEPADQAAALLLFFARDGLQDMRMAADIAAWWDRHGHDLSPAALDDRAERHPELGRPLRAAADVLERLVGVPSSAWLSESRDADRRVGLAARVADWTQASDRDQLSANISLVDALLAPPGGLADAARRQLLTVRQGSRAAHVAKTCARFALAWVRARRGPWEPLPPLPR